MSGAFVQIPSDDWPLGLEVRAALIKLQPDEFEEIHQIQFDEELDDFDYYKVAILKLPSNLRIGLVQYRGSQHLGTEIWLGRDSLDHLKDLKEFLFVLNLPSDSLQWIRED